MKDELRVALESFVNSSLGADSLRSNIMSLIDRGLRKELSSEEAEMFSNFMIWYLDMYDEQLQPRSGLVGAVRDRVDQVVKGEYRVSLDAVRRSAAQLLDVLK